MYLHLSISNGLFSSKIYDKRDDFDFDIVNFPFLDGDVPRRPSDGVYISQLIRFARVVMLMTLIILILLISRSLMAMSLNVLLMVYIYLNLFALPEHLRMLLTSIIVTNS